MTVEEKKPKSFLRLNRNVVVSRLKSKNEEAAMQKNVKCALETFWLPFMAGNRNTCKYAEIGNNKQLS